MQYLKVGGAALNQTPLDWRGNRERILAAIDLARGQGVQVLCLPELCISGYGCEDAFHGESVAAEAMESLRSILPATRGLMVALGLPLIHKQQLFNAAALAVDGRLGGVAAKRVLAGYGVYYEPRWFKAWPHGVMDTFEFEGQPVPLGDLAFEASGVQLGFEICEDAWGREASRNPGLHPDVVLNPSASHFAFEKYPTLRAIVAEGSRTTHGLYIYANLTGNEAGRLIFDGATLIGLDGRIIAENARLNFAPVQLTTAVADLRAIRLARRRLNYSAGISGDDTAADDASGEHASRIVPLNFALQEAAPQDIARSRQRGAAYDPFTASMPDAAPVPDRGPFDDPTHPHNPAPAKAGGPVRFDEFARAVSLGLWDYMRKSRSKGFAVSLSGGVDSSSVAVLVWTMVQLALEELGAERFCQSLAHIEDLPSLLRANGSGREPMAGNPASQRLVARLLLTVYQGSEQSSNVTRMAARDLAEQLGSRHVEMDIGPLVSAYEGLAEAAIGRDLEWGRDDLARQNIQARVRSPGIWLLANVENRLLLCTSNRSEVGVGYATMDGDTSGGLAPIAGANKSFLRAWLAHVERRGVAGLPALPALSAVNAQAPTAELRPARQQQTDEDDLMPYAVLDMIEQAAIRDRMAPVEVWRLLMATPLEGLALDAKTAAAHVDKFFRLWGRSQWKRERLAPSFHLDDENLDPRTWCRFPILSGGYETELEALSRQAAME